MVALFIGNYATCFSSSIHISKIQWEAATNATVKKYEASVDAKLLPDFQRANLRYPPQQIALLTFKKEKNIELWAKDNNASWKFIRAYPLTAFSGTFGPKLHMNDSQIPEGIYKIVELNPFSTLHLSMMLNYPNEFDRSHAQEDGRKNLGNNIFIHGKNLSVGCLAVGDAAMNQLFVLVKRVGARNTTIIIAPNDLRKSKAITRLSAQPIWVPQLYAQLSQKLAEFNGNQNNTNSLKDRILKMFL